MSKTIEKLLAMPHVRAAFQDSDGYWVSYREGVVSPRTECRSDHEYTAAEILKAAREARSNMVRPVENWTIVYARKMFHAGRINKADVATFVAMFGDGLTVEEVIGGVR